uniref:Uncharacterized protein n=1 Tax=Romanomermis culicivorax TaxID=13658 RepID=A0A915IRW6_ROMCU
MAHVTRSTQAKTFAAIKLLLLPTALLLALFEQIPQSHYKNITNSRYEKSIDKEILLGQII